MKNLTVKARKSQRGQGMTEYIIIVAMVAIAAIAVYQLFGKTVRNQTAAMAMELSGKSGTAATGAAQTAASTAQTQANTAIGLDNYTGQAASNR